mmetsp:Transcript_26576/g.4685  ORF Transcript_26576/g.4685 Transcript_26576/m.4685 type:complete len:125 (-) Transcript_26576:3351-3725(-)
MEINRPADGNKFKATTEVQYAQDRPNDFPVSLHLLGKYGLVGMVTKFGYFYLFETISANLVYRTVLSEDTIFVSCKSTTDDTVVVVNRRGQVIGVTINEQNLVPFITNNCRHIQDPTGISFRLA